MHVLLAVLQNYAETAGCWHQIYFLCCVVPLSMLCRVMLLCAGLGGCAGITSCASCC